MISPRLSKYSKAATSSFHCQFPRGCIQHQKQSYKAFRAGLSTVSQATGKDVNGDSHTHDDTVVKSRLRTLLRESAQPVAVVTARIGVEEEEVEGGLSSLGLGSSSGSGAAEGSGGGGGGKGKKRECEHRYHGATLSSFTSIAMDPYPLVAFSLRIPSRMAVCLDEKFKTRAAFTSLTSSLSPSSSPSTPYTHSKWHTADMVINLLSSAQTSTAVIFSRADLYPNPFRITPSPSSSSSSPTSESESESELYSEVKYNLTKDGIPVLEGSLGSIACQLVAPPIPLHDLDYLGLGRGLGLHGRLDSADGTKAHRVSEDILKNENEGEKGVLNPSTSPSVTSELFIARVVSVERLAVEDVEDGNPRTVPLLYRRRGYVHC